MYLYCEKYICVCLIVLIYLLLYIHLGFNDFYVSTGSVYVQSVRHSVI